MLPVTQYARSGEASIAYQVVGDGPLDMLFLTGWITQVEQLWEAPANRRFLERLGGIGRLIMFDGRGTGLSDRVLESYRLEQEMEDALAVLDAAGSERAALFSYSVGGLVAALLAAEHPERVGALVMYASTARTSWAPDYDWAMKKEEREALTERTIAAWGVPNKDAMDAFAPSMGNDPALAEWFARLQRLAASPSEARTIFRAMVDLDVRDVLPRIRVPTLVIHRPRERVWDVRHSRYLAEHIPGARYVELEGEDSFPFVGDSDAMVEEIAEFLTGGRGGAEPARALLTVMFTDIVDSTARAAVVGDGRWRDLLARHDEEVRKELARFGGREVKTFGDGFLAIFDGAPSRALRCALAITEAAGELGIDVRVGMHTGECELIGEDVGGMAVHIASRVNALAGAGEVLVSGTVFGTVVGGPFTFEDRGFHELKGVPGRWPLFALGAREPGEAQIAAPTGDAVAS
jgi:class 3 adenylate cyclase/esterase/lipase